jgi:hypothetical protein
MNGSREIFTEIGPVRVEQYEWGRGYSLSLDMWTQAGYPFNLMPVGVAKIILYGSIHWGFREVLE